MGFRSWEKISTILFEAKWVVHEKHTKLVTFIVIIFFNNNRPRMGFGSGEKISTIIFEV